MQKPRKIVRWSKECMTMSLFAQAWKPKWRIWKKTTQTSIFRSNPGTRAEKIRTCKVPQAPPGASGEQLPGGKDVSEEQMSRSVGKREEGRSPQLNRRRLEETQVVKKR